MKITPDFKVTVSAHAKNHAFRLAEALDQHGVLDRIYTTYPKFKMSSYRISRDRIASLPLLGALKYLSRHTGAKFLDDPVSDIFSWLVKNALKKPTGAWVFHGLSGYCEAPLQKAKKLGAVTVVDRGCPHIDAQQDIIAEEKARLLNTKVSPAHKYVYDRMKREYEMTDYIVVPSRYSGRSFFERGFSPEKVRIVPLCNEKATSFISKPKKLNRFTVLCTGGDFYRKGLFYLLEGWRKLNLSDAELIFKGSVPKEFKHLLNARNIRHVTKYLSDNEIAGLYQEAHVFVLPSIDEGFGMVVAEAMSAGLPIIVTENVGAADSIENGKEGFVVPIRSSDALAEKIKFFYDHSEKIQEMGKAAMQKSRFYSPEAYGERVIKIYLSILA